MTTRRDGGASNLKSSKVQQKKHLRQFLSACDKAIENGDINKSAGKRLKEDCIADYAEDGIHLKKRKRK